VKAHGRPSELRRELEEMSNIFRKEVESEEEQRIAE
jgi:hypothetical protein